MKGNKTNEGDKLGVWVCDFTILYNMSEDESCGEWESFRGTLDEAIQRVEDKRYRNYGRNGAKIIQTNTLYKIEVK